MLSPQPFLYFSYVMRTANELRGLARVLWDNESIREREEATLNNAVSTLEDALKLLEIFQKYSIFPVGYFEIGQETFEKTHKLLNSENINE